MRKIVPILVALSFGFVAGSVAFQPQGPIDHPTHFTVSYRAVNGDGQTWMLRTQPEKPERDGWVVRVYHQHRFTEHHAVAFHDEALAITP